MGCSGSVPAHVSAKIVEDIEDEEDVILRRRHGNCHEVFLSTLATCHKPLGNEVVKDHGLVSATLGKTGIAANGKELTERLVEDVLAKLRRVARAKGANAVLGVNTTFAKFKVSYTHTIVAVAQGTAVNLA